MIDKIKEFYRIPAVPFVNLGANYLQVREEVLKRFDQISSQGAYILTEELQSFEDAFAKFCGTSYALGVGNGADALFLSLKALGIKEGDEVITAPNSFIASAGIIDAAGAKIVFVDVGDDYNINPELIEKAITPRTKAIIPIHLTGRPAEMDTIMQIAMKHHLFVVEDAAQAVGARYKNRRVGSLGDTGCFSLHPLKNLHVHGDGGVITTNDYELYKKLLLLRNHGLKNRDECVLWAYNSRLDAIQAGIAGIKLKHLDKWNQRYREIAEMYRKGLSTLVETPVDKPQEEAVYHNFIIQTDQRDELQKYLLQLGIETKVHYPIPLHLQEAAKELGYKEGDFPVTEKQAKRILSLPIYPELTDEQVNGVIGAIKSFFSVITGMTPATARFSRLAR
ncbi:MAG TPA: DegT/DnrJ/EryC1/StrS family aminotransferase [Candidatus Nanoarchaeia archaeon]|nr:DegT/DnrJ/EryC1/StrS family aminotransferase [Candidatus Nanoarchaeia archaeon]